MTLERSAKNNAEGFIDGKNDVFALLPTGFDKSLIYQLAGWLAGHMVYLSDWSKSVMIDVADRWFIH